MREGALHVYTARVTYQGPDRLDITRKSGGPSGWPFAPSWRLLSPYLAKRRQGALTSPDWERYRAAYTEEMRASYRRARGAWEALLSRPEVTLVCYCPDPARCHRRLLAALLVRCGASDRGERGVLTGGATCG